GRGERGIAVAELHVGAVGRVEGDAGGGLRLDVTDDGGRGARGVVGEYAGAAVADLGVGDAEGVRPARASPGEHDRAERGPRDLAHHRDAAGAARALPEVGATVAYLDVARVERAAGGAAYGAGLHHDVAGGADVDRAGDRAVAGEGGAFEPPGAA